jgi:hypothetical protein
MHLEVYAWSFVVKNYTLFHYRSYVELSKIRFYQIKGGHETTLCHASDDTLHGPNQISQFSIEFQRLNI